MIVESLRDLFAGRIRDLWDRFTDGPQDSFAISEFQRKLIRIYTQMDKAGVGHPPLELVNSLLFGN